MKRPIAAIPMTDVTAVAPATPPPVFMMVRPEELLVDETYQRDLSDASLRLIRKIVVEWDWRKFKAPVVAMTDDGPVLIDGQHTSIGAASHPLVEEIPVLVVEAAAQEDQARAFVGINTSRLGITAAQLHHASVAAGDPAALAIDRVCRDVGVSVRRLPPSGAVYKPGETIAVAALAGMLHRKGEAIARRVLGILVEAGLAPIQAAHMRAVETLLTDAEFADVAADDLHRVIIAVGIGAAERDAKTFAATHGVPMWRALAATWFKARRAKKAGRNIPGIITDAATPSASSADRQNFEILQTGAASQSARGVDATSTPPVTPSRVAQRSRHVAAVEAARLAVPAPSFSGPGRAGR